MQGMAEQPQGNVSPAAEVLLTVVLPLSVQHPGCRSAQGRTGWIWQASSTLAKTGIPTRQGRVMLPFPVAGQGSRRIQENPRALTAGIPQATTCRPSGCRASVQH